jgi:hypothetical protein
MTNTEKLTALAHSLMVAGVKTDTESVTISTVRAVALAELERMAKLADIGQQASDWQEQARRTGAVTVNTGAFAGEWVR